jgi:uncharacterized protein
MIQKTLKKLKITLGLICLLLAIVGVIIPLLPTTPFALLAIYFFNQSSPEFHRWCLKIPGIGSGIEDWQKYRVIKTKAKIQAIILLIISATVILFKDNIHLGIKIGTLSLLLGVLIFLITRRSRQSKRSSDS